jgi:hypothetical protein
MKAYQFFIENNSKEVQKAVLFGHTKNIGAANFGSDIGIKITPSQPETSYLELLEQTVDGIFHANRVTIFTAKVYPESFKIGTASNNRTIDVIKNTGTISIFSISLKPRIGINVNTFIEIDVPAESNLTITLLP